MAYIKYKEVTKYFNFSKYIDSKLLPKYTLDYVFEDEKMLVSYKIQGIMICLQIKNGTF